MIGVCWWRHRLPSLETFLGEPVSFMPFLGKRLKAVAGWGRKQSYTLAQKHAAVLSLPVLGLEDGFLRSFGTGRYFPPLSLVVDDTGIYYDSTRPSRLEILLNSPEDLLAGRTETVRRARQLILAHRLSKYNHAPNLQESVLRSDDRRRVLVVDQTFGDMSVVLGAAHKDTFLAMLDAALAENPDATIYIKTHPEVSSGLKVGYLAQSQGDERTVILRDPVNPLSLLEHMDHVYVVSSTMGFEALLFGKQVTCFGLPWYAGWGITDDRQDCARRIRKRSVDELFAAAYFDYTKYLDPTTHRPGTIFDVINWLALQRRTAFGAGA